MSKQKAREVFSNKILERAKKDSSIFVVCSDSMGSAMIEDFAKELPEQFVEIGIAEQNAVTVASGLASLGKKVFVIGPASFYSTRAAEQIKVDVAYSNNNVKIIAISGGISYGNLGATHHSVQDIAFMRAIPNLDVLIPTDGNQMEALVDVLLDNNKPAYVRIGRGEVDDIYDKSEKFKIGGSKTLRKGHDIAIFACGQLVSRALSLSNLLEERGYKASVVDLYSVKPIDRETVVNIAKKCGVALTIEEHSLFGGLGSIIAEILAQEFPIHMHIAGIPDEEIPNGSDSEVFDVIGLNPQNLLKEALSLINIKTSQQTN